MLLLAAVGNRLLAIGGDDESGNPQEVVESLEICL